VVLAAIHPSDIATWGRYAQAVAHGSLTLIVFGSILVGKPFTEPYAREQAPERVWQSSRFHELNRRLSAVWGLAFLLGTISLVIAGSQDSRQFILRLAVPFGALLLALSLQPEAGQPVRRRSVCGLTRRLRSIRARDNTEEPGAGRGHRIRH
jgi:peptidoglycan/LPS O-acetylase OafA/YrhL